MVDLETLHMQLTEMPNDLAIWRAYLSYSNRMNLIPYKYFEFLNRSGIKTSARYRGCLDLVLKNKIKDLDLLRNIFLPDITEIGIRYKDNDTVNSLSGLEDVLAPLLKSITLSSFNGNLEHILPQVIRLTFYMSKVNIAPTIDILGIKELYFFATTINNMEIFNKCSSLKVLLLQQHQRPTELRLVNFPKLEKLFYDSDDILLQLGDSISIDAIFFQNPASYNLLTDLVKKGWYPNLEHPIKGNNKR